MSLKNFSSPFRLADRVAAARQHYFVGRAAELELFQAALATPEPPFAVLHVYGPGGIGKTTLLHEYGRIAQENDLSPLYLDCRSMTPSPAGFLQALGQTLGKNSEQNPLHILNQQARSLLFVDTYEKITPLDGWLQESFLPQLPGHSLVVIAGRNPPSAGWRTTPGWRDLVRIISLRNLPPQESRAYLSARQIPAARQTAVLEFTHGHPLALSLVADVLHQGQTTIETQMEPDVVRLLLEKFLENVPSAQHRRALELCAHVRVTTESLLAAILGEKEAPALFAWLRTLSFIEQGSEGLFPHDLAREVLDADLRSAWMFALVADPDFWQPMFTFYNLWRVPEADFVVGERRFGAFSHDWRVEPIVAWSQVIRKRVLDSELKLETLAPPPPLLALSQPEFIEAVRQALRISSDLTGWQPGRQWDGTLNALVLLLFLVNTALSIRRRPGEIVREQPETIT